MNKRIVLSLLTVAMLLGLPAGAPAQDDDAPTDILGELEPITVENADRVVELARLGHGVAGRSALTSDQTLFAIADAWGVWVYDTNDLDSSPRLLDGGYIGHILDLEFSPDGTLLAGGSKDGFARVWDVATGEILALFYEEWVWVRTVAFSPDGSLLFWGGFGRIGIWDVSEREKLPPLDSACWYDATEFIFSPDGRYLAVESVSFSDYADACFELWDLDTRSMIVAENTGGSLGINVTFDVNGAMILMSYIDFYDDTHSRIFDVATGRRLDIDEDDFKRPPPPAFETIILPEYPSNAWVRDIAFSPDGALLVSAHSDGVVQIWDVFTGTPQTVLQTQEESMPLCVVFAPGENLLATGYADSIIRLWDARTGDLQSSLEGHANQVFSLTFSPDGTLLASGGGQLIRTPDNAAIRLWDAGTGAEVAIWDDGHTDDINSLAFSPDGTLLAAGRSSVQVWAVETGTQILELDMLERLVGVEGLAFSPDGELLAIGVVEDGHGGSAGFSQLWQVGSDAEPILLGETRVGLAIRSVAFNPDGTLLADGGGDYHTVDNVARLWDVETQTLLIVLEGHTKQINSVAFSPDGTLLATGSADGTIRLWGVPAE